MLTIRVFQGLRCMNSGIADLDVSRDAVTHLRASSRVAGNLLELPKVCRISAEYFTIKPGLSLVPKLSLVRLSPGLV